MNWKINLTNGSLLFAMLAQIALSGICMAAPPPKDGISKSDDGGQIEGAVLSCEPFGIADIQVSVPGESLVAYTNASGEFVLYYVPPGFKDITFAKDNQTILTLTAIEVSKRTVTTLGPVELCTDADGDGYDARVDCDDTDDAVHPGLFDGVEVDIIGGQPVALFIDNDCDGFIDEDVKDGVDRYIADESCGSPINNCALLIFNGLPGACNSYHSFVPFCSVTCSGNCFDTNGNPSDGCECCDPEPLDTPDMNFIDSNCDGIDGDEGQAIFVSTQGDDEPLRTGGGTKWNPLKTVDYAMLQLVNAPNKDYLVIAKGVYYGRFDYDNYWGGYDDTNGWTRMVHDANIYDPYASVICAPGTLEINDTNCNAVR